jgi:ABC-type uncharacterized transport system involved in gliding motility auxiliary subunit
MNLRMTLRNHLRVQTHVTTLLLVLLLVLVAYASQRYRVQWDWTAEQRRSLSEQSVKAVRELPGEIRATLFFRKGDGEDARDLALALLEKYRVVNPRLEIQTVDVALDPAAARKAEITTNGTVTLQAGSKTEKVTDLTEESMTNALIRLAKGGNKTVYFIMGHGESSPQGKEENGLDVAATLLKGEGYTVETLNLATVEAVPETATVLVLAGPRKALLPVEVERLQRWLEARGRLLLMVDPAMNTGLEPWLEKWQLRWQPGLVIDLVARLFGGGPTTPLVTQYDPGHTITRNLTAAAFFPEARGLSVGDPVEGSTVTRLMVGAEKGWIETGDTASGRAEFNADQDIKGPVTLGVALEYNQPQAGGRLVMVGDSDFSSNAYINVAGNGDLLLNMVRWLAEDENFIAIKPKKITDSGLTLDNDSMALMFWGLVVLVPMLLTGSGVVIWQRRKRR